jgi:hypothetical protein
MPDMRNGVPEHMAQSNAIGGTYNNSVGTSVTSVSHGATHQSSSYMSSGMSLVQNMNSNLMHQEFSMNETHMKMNGLLHVLISYLLQEFFLLVFCFAYIVFF